MDSPSIPPTDGSGGWLKVLVQRHHLLRFGCRKVMSEPGYTERFGLTADSHFLLIATEDTTDPEIHRDAQHTPLSRAGIF